MSNRTTLVSSATQCAVYTPNVETDVRTAVTRGLAEYLESLKTSSGLNRSKTFQLVKVLDVWAEAEEIAKFPSACVYAVGDLTYDASRMTPKVIAEAKFTSPITKKSTYLATLAELSLPLSVELYANDPVERMACVKMIEDGLNPVSWMYGARLALPHYHGAHATYELLRCSYGDDGESVQRRLRSATFSVQVSCPQLRLFGLTEATSPRFDLAVSEGADAATTST